MLELILIFIAGWMVTGWLMRWNSLNKQKERNEKRRLPCPHCAERILPEAKICPHCRTPLTADPAAPWGPRPPATPPRG